MSDPTAPPSGGAWTAHIDLTKYTDAEVEYWCNWAKLKPDKFKIFVNNRETPATLLKMGLEMQAQRATAAQQAAEVRAQQMQPPQSPQQQQSQQPQQQQTQQAQQAQPSSVQPVPAQQQQQQQQPPASPQQPPPTQQRAAQPPPGLAAAGMHNQVNVSPEMLPVVEVHVKVPKGFANAKVYVEEA